MISNQLSVELEIEQRADNGMEIVYLRSMFGKSGDVTLKAVAEGLTTAALHLEAVAGE